MDKIARILNKYPTIRRNNSSSRYAGVTYKDPKIFKKTTKPWIAYIHLDFGNPLTRSGRTEQEAMQRANTRFKELYKTDMEPYPTVITPELHLPDIPLDHTYCIVKLWDHTVKYTGTYEDTTRELVVNRRHDDSDYIDCIVGVIV